MQAEQQVWKAAKDDDNDDDDDVSVKTPHTPPRPPRPSLCFFPLFCLSGSKIVLLLMQSSSQIPERRLYYGQCYDAYCNQVWPESI